MPDYFWDTTSVSKEESLKSFVAWERGELPIILGHKRQQRARKSLGARKIKL